MAEQSYLLVDLKDTKSKKLAQVISNDTSRKILDRLSKSEATETEIAKELSVPLSTVHYNLQHLVSSGLVVTDEYHYSEKGKEINHYRISNKFIVIAPAGMSKVKQALKSLLPVTLISAGAAAILQLIHEKTRVLTVSNTVESLAKSAPQAAVRTMDAAVQAEPVLAAVPPEAAPIATAVPEVSIALWFLYGALFAIVLFLIWELIRRKLDK